MGPEEIRNRPGIEGLAYVAGASIEECLHHGAAWTFSRILERRSPLPTILVVRRLAAAGGSYGKRVVGWARPELVEALGDAIDRADAPAAIAVLDEWVMGCRHENERLVRGLLEAFDREGAAPG